MCIRDRSSTRRLWWHQPQPTHRSRDLSGILHRHVTLFLSVTAQSSRKHGTLAENKSPKRKRASEWLAKTKTTRWRFGLVLPKTAALPTAFPQRNHLPLPRFLAAHTLTYSLLSHFWLTLLANSQQPAQMYIRTAIDLFLEIGRY